jgi:DNA helicase II / ATP-dependent DNA helicase PcrA
LPHFPVSTGLPDPWPACLCNNIVAPRVPAPWGTFGDRGALGAGHWVPMNSDDLLAALDPEQREVALTTRGPVCVLAGAGTGKTRAVTHRIAYAVASGVVNPVHVLALTFTVRAAGELRSRLRDLGGGAEAVRASTFHSAALRQLTYFWPRVIGGRPPKLVESKLPLVREAARDMRLRLDGAALADAVTEIEWAKVCQTHPDSYLPAALSAGRTPSAGAEEVARLYQAYEHLRRDRQLIDFESVLELTAAILFTEPAMASEVHAAFRYFTVDEFQDVNPLQKLLLDAWVGGRDDVCVVGDPRQTIYSFTGATPSYLRDFVVDYPDATVVRLVRDYRSTPQVVAVANRLAAGSGGDGAPATTATSDTFGALVAQRRPGPEPLVSRYDDEEAEAAGVATQAAVLIAGGVPPQEIAILVRVNAHMERFEVALAAAKVPFVVRGAERFYERPEVRQALVLIRGAARADMTGADPSLAPGDMPAAVRDVLASAGLTAEPSAARGAVRERWESLAAIAGLAQDMAAALPQATLADFAAELARRAEVGHAPVATAVTLATMHAAKGLEWDAVLMPGLVEGIMPIVHARTPEAIEEERRLLYVAVTRARQHLQLSWAPARTPGAAQARQRSRFLRGLFPALPARELASERSSASRRGAPPDEGGARSLGDERRGKRADSGAPEASGANRA